MVELDKDSPVALYHQMKEALAGRIRSKDWRPGDRIPTEGELGEQYGVSRITVRQALAELVHDGLLIRRQGKGTFVAVPRIEQSLMSFYSFTEEFRKRGFIPHNRVLDFNVQLADPDICERLDLRDPNPHVYYLKRLRYADEVVMAVEATYLSRDLFPGLSREMLDDHSLYEIMHQKYGVGHTSADESFGATLISAEEALYFGLQEGSPAIDLERITFEGDRRIEYTRSVVRGDKFRFRMQLR